MTGYKQLFSQLERNEPQSPAYSLAQDEVYSRARRDRRVSNVDAIHISELLFEGEVTEAETYLDQALNSETLD